MPSRLPNALIVTSALLLTACGGGGSSAPAPTEPTLQARTSAVEQTVSNNARCTILSPFYWEIGDKDSHLAFGTGGDGSATPPTVDTVMAIASASKWVFAAWVLQQESATLDADQKRELNFTSGYHSLSTASCLSNADTVDACLSKNGNDTLSSADVGKFYYNGGHMQQLAHGLGLGGDYINNGNASQTPKLNASIASGIAALQGQGQDFLYTNPMLAGGISTSANVYAGFLRAILADNLLMHDYLGADAVCAWTNMDGCDALYSPVNETAAGSTNDVSDEKWHYSLGHWVEDAPDVGDGAFSSAGAGGFYPWIDASKTWYGILARFQSPATSGDDSIGTASVHCGRLLRHAWITGAEQTGINP